MAERILHVHLLLLYDCFTSLRHRIPYGQTWYARKRSALCQELAINDLLMISLSRLSHKLFYPPPPPHPLPNHPRTHTLFLKARLYVMRGRTTTTTSICPRSTTIAMCLWVGRIPRWLVAMTRRMVKKLFLTTSAWLLCRYYELWKAVWVCANECVCSSRTVIFHVYFPKRICTSKAPVVLTCIGEALEKRSSLLYICILYICLLFFQKKKSYHVFSIWICFATSCSIYYSFKVIQ